MIFGCSVFLGLFCGLLAKGRLANLANIRFRHSYLVLFSILIQLVIFNRYWDQLVPVQLVTTISYFLALVLIYIFLMLNLTIMGMKLIATGTLLNAVAIFSNKGSMPTSLEAFKEVFPEQASSLVAGNIVYNSKLIDPSTHFKYLCDIFWVPNWFPLANVFSIGDVFICIGAFLLIYKTMTSYQHKQSHVF